jgi:predicted SAM-dependent methyltransferase
MTNRLLALMRRFRPRRDVMDLLRGSDGRVHVGCNDIRIPGFVNVDVRRTAATDVVHDCKDVSIFPNESLSFVFSNAFFEHLYLSDRVPFLKDLRRALRTGGMIAFSGLPDFEGVARAYIERRTPGNVSPEFDLYEAYRYTHGAPEGRPSWWLAQLHKGLLDSPTINALLDEAGFATRIVFRYKWGKEPNAVTIGFVAYKQAVELAQSIPKLRGLFGELPTNINWESLEICTP